MEYHRVEEDWKADAIKLARMKGDIQDNRYHKLTMSTLLVINEYTCSYFSKSDFKRDWVRRVIKEAEVAFLSTHTRPITAKMDQGVKPKDFYLQ